MPADPTTPVPADRPMVTPVQLPTSIGDDVLAWDQWKIAPVLSHVPNDCETCDFAAPPATATATCPDRPGRWFAIRCRRCQATRVITWIPVPLSFGSWAEVWSAPAQPYEVRVTDNTEEVPTNVQ